MPILPRPAPLSGQKHRFIPTSCGLVAVSETADALHHLRISDPPGKNRTFSEGSPGYPRGDPWSSRILRGFVEAGEYWESRLLHFLEGAGRRDRQLAYHHTGPHDRCSA